MSGSARAVQVTLGTRQVGAAILAAALAFVLAVVALGPLAATNPVAVPAAAAPPIVTPEPHHPGTGGNNQQRLPQ